MTRTELGRAEIERWLEDPEVDECRVWQRCAVHLTDRHVIYEARKPAQVGFGAVTTKDLTGWLHLQVDDGAAPKDRLTMFLHECAHARLHGDGIGESGNHAAPPGSLAPQDASERKRLAYREPEADRLAGRWLLTAETYADEFKQHPEGLRPLLVVMVYEPQGRD